MSTPKDGSIAITAKSRAWPTSQPDHQPMQSDRVSNPRP